MRSKKSILIIGGSGFVGGHLARQLRDEYRVIATYCKCPTQIPGVTFFPLNLLNRRWTQKLLHTLAPDIVIYAAGQNESDKLDETAHFSSELHALGPTNLAHAIENLQPRVIFLSSSYVFDGLKGAYEEQDITLPHTTLGRTKLGGENTIKTKFINHVILRSSPLFGRGFGNHFSFFDELRLSLNLNRRIVAQTNELHSFGSIFGLCDLVSQLIDSGIRNKTLHYGGLTKISYLEFGKSFAKHFKYDPNLITSENRAFSSHEDSILDFSLNSTQAVQLLKVKPLLLEESFDLIQKQLITHF